MRAKMRTPRTLCAHCALERWGETPSSPDMLDRQKRSGFEGTLAPPRFMGREHLPNLDVNRGHEPIHWWGETPSSPDILIGKNARVRRSLTPPRFMERIAGSNPKSLWNYGSIEGRD